MNYSIQDLSTKEVTGMHYGARIFLPLSIHIFHVLLVKKSLMTDGKDLQYTSNFSYHINDDFTEINFPSYEDLSEQFSEEDFIKIYVSQKGNDIFKEENRFWLKLNLLENNIVNISKL